MANHCWNWVQIIGERKTLEKIQKKFEKYEETNYFAEFGDYVLGKGKIGDDVEILKQRHEDVGYSYGTRWWDFTMDAEDTAENTVLTITGDSAWGPPNILICQIAKVYGVKTEIEYDEPGMGFAGKVSWDESGVVIDGWEGTSDEMRYNDDVGGWIEDRMYCYEGENNQEYTYKKLRKDYSYATKEHIRELREEIIKLNE